MNLRVKFEDKLNNLHQMYKDKQRQQAKTRKELEDICDAHDEGLKDLDRTRALLSQERTTSTILTERLERQQVKIQQLEREVKE